MPASFDVLGEAYDAMIDWEKRLAREAPFYRRIFESAGVKSVLDAACGTGRHAAMFASWGLEVVGADVSAQMIEQCRSRHTSVGNLAFEVRSFTEPAGREFDAVVCAGNSLALAADVGQVRLAIKAMMGSLGDGGVLVLHVLNLLAREEGAVRWDKCKRAKLSSGDALIIKGTHRAGDHGFVDFLLADLSNDPPQLTAESVPFLMLRAQELASLCHEAGCGTLKVLGGCNMDEYAAAKSSDLIIVGRKAIC